MNRQTLLELIGDIIGVLCLFALLIISLYIGALFS